MDVTLLPFNRLIGLEQAPEESGFLVSLADDARYTNHVGTVHASALFAVAEAGSGVFLLQSLGDVAGLVPLVRRVESRFRKPATGRVSARAVVEDADVSKWKADLARRGRTLPSVAIEVVDGSGQVVFTATFDWFISKTDEETKKD